MPGMALNFPNQSRSYDATRHRIRFWGYDRALEISFFLEVNTLYKMQPRTPDNEAGYLEAFDAGRDLIYAAAKKLYGRGRHSSYVLAPDDF
jgi:Protein of unknown function (DUF1488)